MQVLRSERVRREMSGPMPGKSPTRRQLVKIPKLFSGADGFNAWRQAHPDRAICVHSRIGGDAGRDTPEPLVVCGSNVDLTGYDLSEVDFSYSAFSKVNFTGANLTGSIFRYCSFAECTFESAILEHAVLDHSTWYKSSLVGADCQHTDLMWAYFEECRLQDADFASSSLSATFCKCDLRAATFGAPVFDHLTATFISCDLDRTSFRNLNFGTSAFVACGLATADFTGTSNLRLVSVDAQSVRQTAKYIRERGLPSRSFADWLQSTSEPVEMVRLFERWAGSAEGYHNVFVSYSHSDRAIAFLLVDGLQTRGIDCWLDREKLYGGEYLDETVRRAIDRASRMIALLSSDAVRPGSYARLEVEYGLQREAETNGDFLVLPVLLEPDILKKNQTDSVIAMLRERVGVQLIPGGSGTDPNAIVAIQKSLEKSIDAAGASLVVPLAGAIERIAPRLRELMEYVKKHGAGEVPADLLLHGISITDYGGSFPVQASGYVDGHEFYFRARWGHWTLEFGPGGSGLDYFDGAIPGANEHTGEMDDGDVAKALAEGIVRFRHAYVRSIVNPEMP